MVDYFFSLGFGSFSWEFGCLKPRYTWLAGLELLVYVCALAYVNGWKNNKLLLCHSCAFSLTPSRRQSMNDIPCFLFCSLWFAWIAMVSMCCGKWLSNEWKIDVICFVWHLCVRLYRMFCSMQCLQPVDPDVQKHRILGKYKQQQQAIKLSTTSDNQQRIIHLFKHVNSMYFPTISFCFLQTCSTFTHMWIHCVFCDLSFIWCDSLDFRQSDKNGSDIEASLYLLVTLLLRINLVELSSPAPRVNEWFEKWLAAINPYIC